MARDDRAQRVPHPAACAAHRAADAGPRARGRRAAARGRPARRDPRPLLGARRAAAPAARRDRAARVLRALVRRGRRGARALGCGGRVGHLPQSQATPGPAAPRALGSRRADAAALAARLAGTGAAGLRRRWRLGRRRRGRVREARVRAGGRKGCRGHDWRSARRALSPGSSGRTSRGIIGAMSAGAGRSGAQAGCRASAPCSPRALRRTHARRCRPARCGARHRQGGGHRTTAATETHPGGSSSGSSEQQHSAGADPGEWRLRPRSSNPAPAKLVGHRLRRHDSATPARAIRLGHSGHYGSGSHDSGSGDSGHSDDPNTVDPGG